MDKAIPDEVIKYIYIYIYIHMYIYIYIYIYITMIVCIKTLLIKF